ncbi:hypothetical protein KR009_002459, partial [Drosophila setifemur]
MYLNYCFTKSASQPGYDVVRRSCPANVLAHHPTARPDTSAILGRARNQSEIPKPSIGRDLYFRRSIKRLRKWRKSKSVPSTPPSKAGPRNLKDSREAAGDNMSRNNGRDSERKSTVTRTSISIPSDRDSFEDFFNIVQDNVLASVKTALEQLVTNCFAESMRKIERILKDLVHQEVLLKQVHRDVINKMTEQSEANLNQFKFITQMLIDNQTVQLRALNQTRANRLRRKEERDLEKEKKLEYERKRKDALNDRERRKRGSNGDLRKRTAGGEVPDERPASRAPQHRLCQQQVPLVYQMCTPCSRQESRGGKITPTPSTQRTTLPCPQRRSTSHSMPDLPGSLTSSPEKASKICSSRQSSNRKGHSQCHPAMTYPPYSRSGSTSPRKPTPLNKSK